MILQAGRNCWRIARAARAALLVDGAAYFAAFREAARTARRSILVAGWDVDSRVDLAPQGADDGLPARLGEFLDTLVAQRKDLHVYVLAWDFAMMYALERELLPVYTFGWRTHDRLHYHLDDRHPPGGSHHQKIAVIDNSLAFVGGIDFAKSRWDTPEHAAQHPHRLLPQGEPYPPFHDATLMVDGEAAGALGELLRLRWRRATGRAPAGARHPPLAPAWPRRVTPDFEEAPVGIARTEPAYEGAREVQEVKQLYLDGIAAARESLYFENQYFTAQAVANAIEARLRADDPPEIALVSRKFCDGWLEQETMETLRAKRLRRLRAADRRGRFRAWYPDREGLGEHCIRLHTKLMIVDERLLRVGSANLNNRSMGLDTECDLAIEAESPRHERAIAALRTRLLAEHLGRPAAELARRIETEGSLIGAVEALRGGRPRTLAELAGAAPADPLVPEPELFDPERPIDAERLAGELLPPDEQPHAARRVLVIAILLVAIAALAAAWRWGPLREHIDPEALAAWIGSASASDFAPLLVLAAYLAASLIALPITLVIVATAVVLGPVEAFVYALAGSLLGGAATFYIGRAAGRGAVRRLAGKRLNRLSKLLARRGILAMATLRLLPVAPFTLVNMVAGASHLRARDFLLGTAIGMAPGTLAVSVFADRLAALVFNPSAQNVAWLALALVVIVAAALTLHRWLARRGVRS
jgi:phosphatidylserine/phosphatidylglycerophosphate/cardiolipin synthase-like enzyme/uncharacterized membrane protein YdjX (TVP38/TMEM64 family)